VILVDTNVVSEPMKTRGDKRVVAWLDRQRIETLFISTITVSEILFGVAALPAGRRRGKLNETFEREIERLFESRPMADGQIAAIAAANRLSVATRDEPPFRAAGVKTVNPWTE
jgi:predicted nucleic acid-binding protein